MPAETERHERTLMAWPTVAMAEIGLWGDAGIDGARDVYATIANVISTFEPLTMVAAPDDDEGPGPVRIQRASAERWLQAGGASGAPLSPRADRPGQR